MTQKNYTYAWARFLVSRVSHPSAQINIIYSEVLNCKIHSNLTFQISILTCFLDKQKRYLSFDRLSELIFFLHFCKRKKAKKQNFLKNLIPHKFRHVRTYHFYTDFAAVLLWNLELKFFCYLLDTKGYYYQNRAL